jgi:hypothetical protein
MIEGCGCQRGDFCPFCNPLAWYDLSISWKEERDTLKAEVEACNERIRLQAARHVRELKQERERNARLVEAAQDILTQNYGLRNFWAGMFKQCQTHGHYAYGGNWQMSEECPYCRLHSAAKLDGVKS